MCACMCRCSALTSTHVVACALPQVAQKHGHMRHPSGQKTSRCRCAAPWTLVRSPPGLTRHCAAPMEWTSRAQSPAGPIEWTCQRDIVWQSWMSARPLWSLFEVADRCMYRVLWNGHHHHSTARPSRLLVYHRASPWNGHHAPSLRASEHHRVVFADTGASPGGPYTRPLAHHLVALPDSAARPRGPAHVHGVWHVVCGVWRLATGVC